MGTLPLVWICLCGRCSKLLSLHLPKRDFHLTFPSRAMNFPEILAENISNGGTGGIADVTALLKIMVASVQSIFHLL